MEKMNDIFERLELDTFKVRTIRGRYVYAINFIKNVTCGVPYGLTKFTGEK